MPIITFSRTNDLTAKTLLDEIRLELFDPNYAGLVHGRPYAYRVGCRGHLCRYVERTRRRAIRHKAALIELPNGVRPDTRPRREQRWDAVLACITQQVCADPAPDITIDECIIEQLGLDSTVKFVELMESFKTAQALVAGSEEMPIAQ